MDVYFYNTLSKKKEKFEPLNPGFVRMYVCGPTVYWFAHIGNLRSYLFSDVLRRTLALNGFAVTLIMNITDVGHLTDDADEGEDKMIIAMKREGKTAYEIADFYTQTFFKDLKTLHILPATAYPKATDHIQEQINMVKKLEQNGLTYQTSDGIYFDTSKLENYGRLSGQKAEEKKAGVRVDLGEKKQLTDFALWKFSHRKQDGPLTSSGHLPKRQMEWDSPWGSGFPGWHIECSAMSMKYLGVPFDIHTGGIDHIAVHHENELAQTQGAEGKLQARFWMHGEYLTVNNGKMSKSLGNLYTIDDLKKNGFDPLAFRYLVLQAHYRTKLNFTFEALTAAQIALFRLYETVRDWNNPSNISELYKEKFFEIMNDDLNTPNVLALMWQLVCDSSLDSSIKSATLLFFDEVLGLQVVEYIGKPLSVPVEVQQLVEKREQARQKKEFEMSDHLREQITESGFLVEDTPEGPKIRKK